MADEIRNQQIDENETAIPLVEERVSFAKRRVETGRVVVRTRVEEHVERLADTLTHEHVEVRRVPVGRPIEAAPAVRTEGGVTIVPVVEERLVVEKRLFLVEEIHLERISDVEQVELDVPLRRMEADIDRTD